MLFLIAGLLFSGCGKNDASDATDISSVKLKSNQKIVIGKITEIAGNEMTYTILKKVSAKSSSSDQSKSGNSGNAPDQSSNSNDSSNAGNTPDQSSSSNDSSNSGNASDQGSNGNDSNNSGNTSGQSKNGNSSSSSSSDTKGSNNDFGGMPAMQNGSSSQGQMPSGGQGDAPGNPPGNPPDANGMQDQQNSTSDSSTGLDSSKSKSTSKSKSNTNSKKKGMTMYTSTNKSATMTIPVGTDVITSLGNKTTFSRLSNGDVIKMIVETDQDGNKVIVGIWMV